MTDPLVNINGQRTTRLSVRVPPCGVWEAEADFDQALPSASLVGAATVQIGPLSLSGTFDPDRTGTYLQQSKCKILGGAGAWRDSVAKRQYHDDGLGVRAVDVITDLAREVGETLGTVTPTVARLGADFVRRAGIAKDVLALAIGSDSWWVDYEGKTNVGTRAQSEIVGEHEILDFDSRQQIATVSTDDLRVIGIGSVLRNRLEVPRVVREMTIEISDGQIRLYCYCPELALKDSRLFSVIAAYVRAALPELPFLGKYRYRVIEQNTGDHRWKLQAVAAAQRLPDISPASVHPGVAGAIAKLAAATEVIVEFIEGNPAMPIITHFAAADGAGFVPVELSLDASNKVTIGESASSVLVGAAPRLAVARDGDMAGPWPITALGTTLKAGA